MSKTLAANLKFLMEANDIKTPTDLARRCGIPQPTLFRLLVGASREPRMATLVSIGNYFGLKPSALVETDLATGEAIALREPTPARREVPLLAWDEVPQYRDHALREAATTVPLQRVSPSRLTFAVKLVGDAMWPELAADKGIEAHLIVDPLQEAVSGDHVVVLHPVTGVAIVRKLVVEGGMCYLRPTNPVYPTVEVAQGALTLLGVAIELNTTQRLKAM